MLLGEFLKKYRMGVKSATGKVYSVKSLAADIGVGADNLTKWELAKSFPKDEKDRDAIKNFFELSDLGNFSEKMIMSVLIKKGYIAEDEQNKEKNINGIPSFNGTKSRNDAIVLNPIDDQAIEVRGRNEFISVGQGRYIMLTRLVHDLAYGGYLTGYKDKEYLDELPKQSIMVNELHKGYYLSFEIRNDSMDNGEKDAIEIGDVVTGREIEKTYWKSKFHTHKYKEFIIVHKDGIIVKEIIAQDVENGIITIHSKNPDKVEYPDEQLLLADVEQIFNVTHVTKTR